MIQDPSYLPNLMDRVVQLACQCLEDSSPLGRPGFCGLYHGSPPADCCDALLVWLERLSATPGPLKCGQVHPLADISVTLYRDCWPTITADPHNPFVGLSDKSDLAAAQLQMDAAALYCCLLSDLSDSGGFIMDAPPGVPSVATMGSMSPGRPAGGCASWTVKFTLELAPCCSMLD